MNRLFKGRLDFLKFEISLADLLTLLNFVLSKDFDETSLVKKICQLIESSHQRRLRQEILSVRQARHNNYHTKFFVDGFNYARRLILMFVQNQTIDFCLEDDKLQMKDKVLGLSLSDWEIFLTDLLENPWKNFRGIPPQGEDLKDFARGFRACILQVAGMTLPWVREDEISIFDVLKSWKIPIPPQKEK